MKSNSSLHVVNLVNNLMLAIPIIEHALPLYSVSSRRLWVSRPGDMLVLPRQPSDDFLAYVCDMLGFSPNSLYLQIANSSPTDLIAEKVLSAPELLNAIKSFCNQGSRPLMVPYAIDKPTVKLARTLDIEFEHYAAKLDTHVISMLYRLNTKSGFRQYAKEAGLPIPEGSNLIQDGDLHCSLLQQLNKWPRVRVKLDRSSSGYGQLSVGADQYNASRIPVDQWLLSCKEQPANYVIERELDAVLSPSVELTVDSHDVSYNYICTQRYRSGIFSGMLCDDTSISNAVVSSLTDAGINLGRHLQGLGYRGVFDLDAVITQDGVLFFTECNLRQTAGTFIHHMLKRIGCDTPALVRVWIADSIFCGMPRSFCVARELISNLGLDYCPLTKQGIILTSDGIEVDGNLRYLILAPNRSTAERIELELIESLSHGSRFSFTCSSSNLTT